MLTVTVSNSPLMIIKIKYPIYYSVNDLPVVLNIEKQEVVGRTGNGVPYPVGKTIVEGYKIKKGEFLKLTRNLYSRDFKESSIQ